MSEKTIRKILHSSPLYRCSALHACQLVAKEAGEAAQLQPNMDMHNVYKRATERLGIHCRILRVWRSTEPLVAAHLHPRLSATSSRSPTHPAKAYCFQYTMTEWAYKVASLKVRAFNSTSMLSAYQVEHDRCAARTDPYSSVSQ